MRKFWLLGMVVLVSCVQDDPWSRTRGEIRQIFQVPVLEMQFRHVIYHSRDREWWNLLDSKREALFAIPVRVQAGFNLDRGFELHPSEDRKTIEVVFPEPEILLADAKDEEILQYFSLPRSGSVSQEELHSLLRQASDQARRQALDMGLLARARVKAQGFLNSLFGLLGFETVILRYSLPEGEVKS